MQVVNRKIVRKKYFGYFGLWKLCQKYTVDCSSYVGRILTPLPLIFSSTEPLRNYEAQDGSGDPASFPRVRVHAFWGLGLRGRILSVLGP